MPHQQVRLHLAHRIQCHAHDNQKARAAQERRHQPRDIKLLVHDRGDHGDHGQRHGADQRDTGHGLVQELRGRTAGPDTGHVAAIAFQIVRNLERIELRGHPEIGEEEDQDPVHDDVERLPHLHRGVQRLGEMPGDLTDQGRREGQHRAGKNDRHHAGVVDAQRHVAVLAAIHLAPHDPLGGVDRDLTLPLCQGDRSGHDQEEEEGQAHQVKDGETRHTVDGLEHPGGVVDRHRQPTHNVDRNDQGNSVTDAPLGDLLTQPHHQHRTGRHRDNGHDDERHTGILHQDHTAAHAQCAGVLKRNRQE